MKKLEKIIIAALACVAFNAYAQEPGSYNDPDHDCSFPIYDSNNQLIQRNFEDRIKYEKINGACGEIQPDKSIVTRAVEYEVNTFKMMIELFRAAVTAP